jgi:hypothetical protein
MMQRCGGTSRKSIYTLMPSSVPLHGAESLLAEWTSCESMCDPPTQARKVGKEDPAVRVMHARTKVLDRLLSLLSDFCFTFYICRSFIRSRDFLQRVYGESVM